MVPAATARLVADAVHARVVAGRDRSDTFMRQRVVLGELLVPVSDKTIGSVGVVHYGLRLRSMSGTGWGSVPMA